MFGSECGVTHFALVLKLIWCQMRPHVLIICTHVDALLLTLVTLQLAVQPVNRPDV